MDKRGQLQGGQGAVSQSSFGCFSLSRFRAKQEERNNPPAQKKETATSTTREDRAITPTSPPCLPGRVGTGSP